jgi:hypothetical protein
MEGFEDVEKCFLFPREQAPRKLLSVLSQFLFIPTSIDAISLVNSVIYAVRIP